MALTAVPPVFCTGIVRSGSTWSFNVCRQLYGLLAQQRRETVQSGYIGEADLESAVGRQLTHLTGPLVLKAHAIGPAAVAAVRAGTAKAVCTFRDPRDCVASDVTFRHKPFAEAVRRVSQDLAYLGYYRSCRRVLFVRYEQMMASTLRQVTRIAEHLNVAADPLELRRIDAATSLASARAVAAGLGHRRPDQVAFSETRRVDPTTQLHENHVHSGRTGRWQDELSADERAEVNDVFHPWLVELGYESADANVVAYV